MNQSNLFLIFLALILHTSSCSSSRQATTPHIPINQITLLQLEAKELSENFHTLSSKKDEIAIFAYLLKNDSILLSSWSKSNLTFTETTTLQQLDFTIKVDQHQNTKIVFILIEQDIKRSKKELDDILQSNFHLLNGIQSQKESLQLLIGDDDLLGLKVWDLSRMSVTDNGKVNFSGVHLFDEYEYILHGKLE